MKKFIKYRLYIFLFALGFLLTKQTLSWLSSDTAAQETIIKIPVQDGANSADRVSSDIYYTYKTNSFKFELTSEESADNAPIALNAEPQTKFSWQKIDESGYEIKFVYGEKIDEDSKKESAWLGLLKADAKMRYQVVENQYGFMLITIARNLDSSYLTSDAIKEVHSSAFSGTVHCDNIEWGEPNKLPDAVSSSVNGTNCRLKNNEKGDLFNVQARIISTNKSDYMALAAVPAQLWETVDKMEIEYFLNSLKLKSE